MSIKKQNINEGFTLLELIVVMSLLSVVLFFSVPKLQDSVLNDDAKKATRWIIGQIRALKEVAVREQKPYILKVDIDNGEFRASNESMEEGSKDNKNDQKSYKLPNGVKVIDIEYLDDKKITNGMAEIFFSPKGYSSKAIIHIKSDDDKQLSFLIEPFLATAKLYNNYFSFEN